MSLVRFLNYHRPAAIMAAAGIGFVVFFLVQPGMAHAAGVEGETAFVFNTFAFMVWGALVMWMCAGFTMLESGSVRTKNAAMICLKNIGIYSIAGLAFFFIGYNLMYVGVNDFAGIIGTFKFLYGPSSEEIALLDASDEAKMAASVALLSAKEAAETVYSTMSDWFFQMVFVATAASIVSGTLGGTSEDVVLLRVHAGADGYHLPHRGCVDLGRRLAEPDGIHGLCRFDHRA